MELIKPLKIYASDVSPSPLPSPSLFSLFFMPSLSNPISCFSLLLLSPFFFAFPSTHFFLNLTFDSPSPLNLSISLPCLDSQSTNQVSFFYSLLFLIFFYSVSFTSMFPSFFLCGCILCLLGLLRTSNLETHSGSGGFGGTEWHLINSRILLNFCEF